MSNLTFDEESHTYRLDGEIIPSVTQILKGAALTPSFRGGSGVAMTKGSFAHLATELDDKGELDEATVDPANLGHLEAWRKFRTESGIEILAIEERVHNDLYRYAGTLDRRVLYQGRESIIDIKTGNSYPWHPIQTAAYALALGKPVSRFSVYLSDAGSYKLEEHTDSHDTLVFMAAIRLADWRSQNGIIEEE